MDLLALRYFREVARREHLSRAAEDLRVSQPSLSRTITRLESELGVPLFDRQGRRIRLNRFGRAFLRRVERALDELRDGRRELADAAGLAHGSIAVAAETLLPLARMLSAFRATHPGVDVRLSQTTPSAMAAALHHGDVDVGIASQEMDDPELETIELATAEVLLAVPLDHRLAGRIRVGVPELAGEPFVTTRPDHWPRALADRLFAAHGLRPTVVCEGDEPGATLDLVAASLGVGLLPDVARAARGDAAVAWVHVDDPGCTRTLTLVRRRDAYLPAVVARFRDHVVATMSGDSKPA